MTFAQFILADHPAVAAAVDTARAVPHAEGSGVFTTLLEHVQDSHELELPFIRIALPQFAPVHLFGLTVDFSITKHVVFVWFAALLLIVALTLIARRAARRPVPTGFGNLIEVFVVFVRDEIVVANMGPSGLRYLSYLLSTFFFILVMNLVGLVPFGASATGNVNVTAGLAIIAFVMIQAAAIRAQGLRHYLKHLTGGVHWILWPMMVPIEILGMFTKAFALCIRLFANMIGGHIVILSLIGLIFIFRSWLIAPTAAGFVVGLDFLELFVAFLQAYIFTILTAIFMGLGMQPDEEGGH